jgi:hypothetical protein
MDEYIMGAAMKSLTKKRLKEQLFFKIGEQRKATVAASAQM